MVGWEGRPPPDKVEWIDAMKPVFHGATGTYHIRFRPGPNGWRFDLKCRDLVVVDDPDVVSNSPETIRFNLVQALRERGKPVDPDWREAEPPPAKPAR